MTTRMVANPGPSRRAHRPYPQLPTTAVLEASSHATDGNILSFKSAECERVFSSAKKMVTAERNRLGGRVRQPIGTFNLLPQKLVFCNSDLDKSTTAPPFIRWETQRYPLKPFRCVSQGRASHGDITHAHTPHSRASHRYVPHRRICHRRVPHKRASHGRVSHGRIPHKRVPHRRVTGMHLMGVYLRAYTSRAYTSRARILQACMSNMCLIGRVPYKRHLMSAHLMSVHL
jgi:hypothetical protein